MAFSAFTILCDCQHCLIPEHLHHPQKKRHLSSSHPTPSPPPAPSNTTRPSVSGLACSGHFTQMGSYTMRSLCLTRFAQHVFQVRPHCSVVRAALLSWLNTISLRGRAAIRSSIHLPADIWDARRVGDLIPPSFVDHENQTGTQL